jgi:hypothetical protein
MEITGRAGVYWVKIIRDASQGDRPIISQETRPLITDYPPKEEQRAAGYPVDDPAFRGCFGHYGYKIIFQRTY